MKIELFLALRMLRDARAQSLLIGLGAAVGVAVIVFLTALISGLQQDLVARTLGGQAHITVRPALERPRPLWRKHRPGINVLTTVEKREIRLRALDDARRVLARVKAMPGVRAAAPICSGPATAQRGAGETNVVVTGLEPDEYDAVIDLRSRITEGALELPARAAVVGQGVADTLGLRPGDRFRLRSGAHEGFVLQLRGVVRYGTQRLDDTTVLVALRDAQTILGLPGGVTAIEGAVRQIYEAEPIAARLRGNTGLDVESWMQRNAQLLTGLRSQSSSSTLIQVFILLSVAIGIASVLVVSVVQRRREIGILRAMGLRRRIARRVFLIQGALLGLVGAGLGGLLGAGLVMVFRNATGANDATRSLPIELSPTIFALAGAISVVTGVLSAVFPAQRAAGLDPAVAIRNE